MNIRLWRLVLSITWVLLLPSLATNEPLAKGVALFQQGEYQHAAVVFQRAIFTESSFSPLLRVWLLKALILSQQWSEAEQLGQTLLAGAAGALAEYRQEVSYLIGRSLLLQDNLSQARDTFAYLIQQNPNHPMATRAYFWLAEILRRQGALSEAEQLFILLLDNFPKHSFKSLAQRGLLLVDTARIRQQAQQEDAEQLP